MSLEKGKTESWKEVRNYPPNETASQNGYNNTRERISRDSNAPNLDLWASRSTYLESIELVEK